jgi:hemolysin activation/secretion protein
VDKETDASLAYWLGAGPWPPNIEAERLDVAGASLELRRRFGLDPARPLGDLWTRLEGGAGDREYGRVEGGAFASVPLGPLQGALDAAAGTSFGDLPVQRLWYLGGPATLRGFPNGALAGDAYWTARLELSTRNPAVRFIAFGDLGWAGPRSGFGDGGPAASAGVGISAMDGLLRIDVARSLRGRDPDAVRVYVRLDGLL